MNTGKDLNTNLREKRLIEKFGKLHVDKPGIKLHPKSKNKLEFSFEELFENEIKSEDKKYLRKSNSIPDVESDSSEEIFELDGEFEFEFEELFEFEDEKNNQIESYNCVGRNPSHENIERYLKEFNSIPGIELDSPEEIFDIVKNPKNKCIYIGCSEIVKVEKEYVKCQWKITPWNFFCNYHQKITKEKYGYGR